MNKLNEKGVSNVMVAVAIAIIAFAVALFYVADEYSFKEFIARERQEEAEMAFDELEEPTGTPEEIDNETVEELDMMLNEIEAGAEVEEELNVEVKGYSTVSY